MKQARFRHLADAYGADPGRWPQAERTAAEALLAQSAEARHWLAKARQLDAWLDHAAAADAPAVTDAQVERMIGAIGARLDRDIPAAAPVPWIQSRPHTGPLWAAVGFLALMGITGVLVGKSGLSGPPTVQSADISDFVLSHSYSLAWNR
jgi:hypothetical protein